MLSALSLPLLLLLLFYTLFIYRICIYNEWTLCFEPLRWLNYYRGHSYKWYRNNWSTLLTDVNVRNKRKNNWVGVTFIVI